MKNILIVIIALFILNACDKNETEDSNPITKVTKCYPIEVISVNSTHDIMSFEYTNDSIINKITFSSDEGTDYTDFIYNTENQIIKSNYYSESVLEQYSDFEYENNVLIKELEFDDDSKKSSALKYSDIFGLDIFNSKKESILAGLKDFKGFEMTSWRTFEYNANNQLSKMSLYDYEGILGFYVTYEYDSNGNISIENAYIIKSETNEIFNWVKIVYEYGDKYYILKDLVAPGYFGKINNIEKIIFTSYEEDGSISGTSSQTYTYITFNEFNYPTQINYKLQDEDGISEYLANITYNTIEVDN